MECIECYSDRSRATPLLKAKDCLTKHRQYVCGACGRCICIERDEKRGVQRWNFPFQTLDIAKLYLRTADATTKKSCGIYEIVSSKNRVSYKIFVDSKMFDIYMNKNKDKSCKMGEPVYRREGYTTFENTTIKYLNQEEIEQYLLEQDGA